MFYLTVPIIVWLCRRFRRDAVLLALFVASLLFRIAFAANEKIAIQLPGQLSYFLVGALIYYHLAFFKRHGAWIMAAALATYALHAWTGLFLFRPAAIATLTLGACLLLPQVKGPTRWGDFSYGTYIFHYPIVQVFVAAGLFRVHPWGALLLLLRHGRHRRKPLLVRSSKNPPWATPGPADSAAPPWARLQATRPRFLSHPEALTKVASPVLRRGSRMPR